MSKRPKNQKAERQKVGRVPRVTSRVLNKADTDDPWIAQTNEHINQFNEFAYLLPTKYGWRFRTKAAFEEELREIAAVDSSPGNLNKLYWEDALKNLEAYTVMSAWRTSELLRNAVSLLSGGETIASAIIARAAIESVAQFLDVTRKVSPTLEQLHDFDFQAKVAPSAELEELILRSVFSSKLPDAETYYNPTNIVSILNRLAKTPGQSQLASQYAMLCEITHPNFLGRSVYMTDIQFGKRSGDEVRTLSLKHGPMSKDLIRISLWAISWAAATQVSSAHLMQSSVGLITIKLKSMLQ